MNFVLQPWQLLVVILTGWLNRQQQAVIARSREPWRGVARTNSPHGREIRSGGRRPPDSMARHPNKSQDVARPILPRSTNSSHRQDPYCREAACQKAAFPRSYPQATLASRGRLGDPRSRRPWITQKPCQTRRTGHLQKVGTSTPQAPSVRAECPRSEANLRNSRKLTTQTLCGRRSRISAQVTICSPFTQFAEETVYEPREWAL